MEQRVHKNCGIWDLFGRHKLDSNRNLRSGLRENVRSLPFKMRDFSNSAHREKKLSFGHLRSAPYVKAVISLNNLFARELSTVDCPQWPFCKDFFAAIGLLPENKEGNVLIYLWQQYFIYLLVRIFTNVTFMSLLKTQEMSYNLLEVICPGKSIFSWKVHEIQKCAKSDTQEIKKS